MVLMVFWTDVEWVKQHYHTSLSRFHGPEGFSHRRGGTSKERFSPAGMVK
jgi:hypothetical protein